MFDEFSIASTAISSFNNAALANPLFFASALLMLPLFFIVCLYGNDFVSKILRWNKGEIENKIGFFSLAVLMIWLLIFGGNYAVIRDGISLLPSMIAIVLFVLTIILTQQCIKQKYTSKIHDKKTEIFILGILLILGGFSAMHTWFGVLLQLSALLCGIIIGSRITKQIALTPAIPCLFGFVTILILMQPEYFRFGQLGNLTFIHLAAILLTGFFAITSLVTRYTNARSKIYESAYIKLKWLFRIVSFLALVLFVSTESVPVFVGLLTSLSLLEMLTIYHGQTKLEKVSKKSWALLLVCFGIITICPVITSLGLIYLIEETNDLKCSDFTHLL